MSSSHQTPCDGLSEAALAGILSSSDLPGCTKRQRRPYDTPGSSDLDTARIPLSRLPKSHFLARGSVPFEFKRPQSTPSSDKAHQLGKPIHKTPSSSTSHGYEASDSVSSVHAHTPSSSRTPTSSEKYSNNSNHSAGIRTPSSGISSDRTLTPGTSSSLRESHQYGTEENESRKGGNTKSPKSSRTDVYQRSSTWKRNAPSNQSSTTSGIGSNITNMRTGYDTSNYQQHISGMAKLPLLNVPSESESTNARQVDSSHGSGFNRCKPIQSEMFSCEISGMMRGSGRRYPTGSAYSTNREGGSEGSSLHAPSAHSKRPRLGQDVENEEDSDEDAMEEVETQIYMSLMWSHGHLGMAYYDLDTQHVYLMPDAKEDVDFQLTRQVLEQVRPHCVIMSASQDTAFVEVLKAHAASNDSRASDDIHQFLQLLPTLEFSYESSKRRALMLHLPGMSEDCSETEQTIHISALVALEKVNMMRAFGGLLKYLDKIRVGIQLEEADTSVPILAIHTFSLADVMVLDDVAYSALDIFKKAENPSTRIAGWSQESRFSLFGILNKCRSVNGAKLLRLWLMRPTKNLQVLQERQEAIGFFKRSANLEVVSKLRACMSGVRSVARILPQMKKNSVSLKNWKILYKTVYNSILVADICGQITPRLAIFKKISQISSTEHLQKIAHHISKIADFEEFGKTGMFCVKPGVDEELDRMKRTYNGLPDFMTLVAKKELENLSEDIQQCNVTYLPQLGYLLVIPVTEKMMSENQYEQPNLDFRFVSNGQAFYKNDATSELDRQLGDTEFLIQDRQTSIMHQLQDIIISHSTALMRMIDCLAELDCLMGLAMVARENNYTCPELTLDNVLSFKAGRHPIQEHLCGPFVPNDLDSGGDSSRMKLLTGPNASGKSVYLKQVALIVFMAHVGSFVPAKSARIGIVDRIFTCLKARESPSMGMSSFMIDLNMVSGAVNCAKGNSLILLDEFGKGTDTVSGMALLVGMMRHWLEQSCPPHTLVSTHFHSIGHDKHLPSTPMLQYQTMDTVIGERGELVFLYQLVSGCATCSHACHVAADAGLPPEIISRGQEVTALLRKEEPVGRVDTPSTAIRQDRCQRIVRKFLELDLDKADVGAFMQNFVLPVDKGEL